MTDHLAWEDFGKLIGIINRIEADIKNVNVQIRELKDLKELIMDHPTRKSNLKKILDVHPDYSITWVTTVYQKLQTLQAYLEDNGYV